MHTRYMALIVAIAALVSPAATSAQERWSLELLPGAAIPTEDLGQAEIETGFGGDGTIGFRVAPHLSVYGGWGWRRFTSEASFAGANVDVEETGYLFGARFEHPMGSDNAPAIVLRLGGTYNHLEIENTDGAIVDDSGHGLGFEAGAGVAVRLGGHWRVTPGVRFRTTDREFENDGVVIPARLRYVTIEVGFSRRF